MKKAKFKTKSPALAKLEKMCAKDPPPALSLETIFELANRLKRERETAIQTDQQSFAA